jgi:excisionase family DNA binding protein
LEECRTVSIPTRLPVQAAALPQAGSLPNHGLTPVEVADYLRIGPDRVRSLIRAGKLGAVNVGANGRPRFVILPQHLTAFVESHAAVPAARTKRRPKRVDVDYFPGD